MRNRVFAIALCLRSVLPGPASWLPPSTGWPAPIGRPGRHTTSRLAATCGPDARHRHQQRIARHHRQPRSTSSRISASRRARSSSSRSCYGRRRSTSSASSTRRSATTPRRRVGTHHYVQRSALRYHRCRCNTELKWKAYRFGYEWDFVYRGPRVRRSPAGLEVHRHRDDALQPGRRVGVRPRARADTRHRRHRPRLRRAEHLDHRRVQRLQAARQHRRGLRGANVLRLRSLRHRQLHRPLRRPGGLSIADASSTGSTATTAISRRRDCISEA